MKELPDPIPLLKEQLAAEIVAAMSGWSQWFAASFLGTDQPRMSDLRAGRLHRFSLEHLIRLLNRIGGSVEITTKWSARHRVIRF